MRLYRSTDTDSGPGDTLVLFFHVSVSDEERSSLVEELRTIFNAVIARIQSNRKPKTLASIPWIRNYQAGESDLFECLRRIERNSIDGRLFIDAQGLKDRTLIVANQYGIGGEEDTVEFGRAGFHDAIVAAVKIKSVYSYIPLEDAFKNCTWTNIPVPKEAYRETETLEIDAGIKCPWPSHIPTDLKLDENCITLFALIKLTEEELGIIQQSIGKEVTIYNWPHDSPASQTDIFDIFYNVKPPYIEPCQTTYVLFIDSIFISGKCREPKLVVAEGFMITDEPNAKESLRMLNTLSLYEYSPWSCVSDAWNAIWNPQSTGNRSNIRSNDYFAGNTPNVSRTSLNTLSNPRIPTVADHSDATIYFLCPATEEEFRKARAVLLEWGFRDMYEYRFIQPPISDLSMEGLLDYFDTPQFRKYSEPTLYFLVIDSEILKTMMTAYDSISDPRDSQERFESTPIILAGIWRLWYDDEDISMVASDKLGYLYGPSTVDEISSSLANLDTGNMDLVELIGGDVETVLWSEYRGVDHEFLQYESY